ncbi:hypothetical protein [Streptomyces sp. MNU103]|uniref:hypothetical protein n=1 Tax=Streptomyces sp. MNU103 TaxID=2560024 RepID=UPI001E4FAEB4|nr:hypothetical protein [Streptomyces sp. MNU103]
MRRRHQRSPVVPFALITAQLFALAACYVVAGDEEERRCRSHGRAVGLVAAVDGRGPGTGAGRRSQGGEAVARPPSGAPAAVPPAVRRPAVRPPVAVPATSTPAPAPSRKGLCP